MVDTPVYTVVAPSAAARIHSRLDHSQRKRVDFSVGWAVIVISIFDLSCESCYVRMSEVDNTRADFASDR